MKPLDLLCVGAMLVGSSACTVKHSLPAAVSLPEPRQACTIGVARFADDTGLDFGPDLRDYLAEHGPCRSVVLVDDPTDARPDVVVSGAARTKMTRDALPAGTMLGTAFTGSGLGLLIVGGISAAVAGGQSCSGYSNAAQCQSENQTIGQVGDVGMILGGVLIGMGVVTYLVDSASVREMKVTGTIEADVDVRRGEASIARWTIKDEVVSRARHPAGRPEGRDSVEAAGPMYPEFFANVFGDIADKLGEAVANLPARGPATPP